MSMTNVEDIENLRRNRKLLRKVSQSKIRNTNLGQTYKN